MKEPRLTLEQYKQLMQRKAEAEKYGERVQYKDLRDAWGISQSSLGTALRRGIKQYDIQIQKENQQ
jgi:hypothetical protein